jgi:hypothetical protein
VSIITDYYRMIDVLEEKAITFNGKREIEILLSPEDLRSIIESLAWVCSEDQIRNNVSFKGASITMFYATWKVTFRNHMDCRDVLNEWYNKEFEKRRANRPQPHP